MNISPHIRRGMRNCLPCKLDGWEDLRRARRSTNPHTPAAWNCEHYPSSVVQKSDRKPQLDWAWHPNCCKLIVGWVPARKSAGFCWHHCTQNSEEITPCQMLKCFLVSSTDEWGFSACPTSGNLGKQRRDFSRVMPWCQRQIATAHTIWDHA